MQAAPRGIRFDMNQDARIVLLAPIDGKWRVRLHDLDTGNIPFENENHGALVRSSKRWLNRFSIEVSDIDPVDVVTLVVSHDYDAAARDVLIQFPVGTPGDILAWFPYVLRFAELHQWRLACAMSSPIIPLLSAAYPHIRFVMHEALAEQALAETAHASDALRPFSDDADHNWQPKDLRHVGLHRTAADILGVDPAEVAPLLVLPDEDRAIEEPYVCIALQRPTQAKGWNSPNGWRDTIAVLSASIYPVIYVDQQPVHGQAHIWTQIPHGCDDRTGDLPPVERARWLRPAAPFVGLSSGLSWLAWAAGTSVMMIGGFTCPNNEFTTRYRVINWHACNSCWNDIPVRFDHNDILRCPHHAGPPRQFEHSPQIISHQVIAILQRIPGCTALSSLITN